MRIVDGVISPPRGPMLSDIFMLRAISPVILCLAGSSTFAGSTAETVGTRFSNQTMTLLQAAYPSGLGTEDNTVHISTNDAVSTAAGIHVYNHAVSGNTSANFLTQAIRDAIISQQPNVIMLAADSNDFAANVDPATTAANYKAGIDDFDARLTKPHVFVIVHQHERYDVSNRAYKWSDYLTALQNMAQGQSKGNVVVVDLAPYFYPLGISPSAAGTDLYSLMNADKIHLLGPGHGVLAESFRRELGIPPLARNPIAAVDTTPPTVPTAPTATAGTTSATLTGYATSTDAVGPITYLIYSSADNYANSIGTTTGTSFTATSLPAGTAVTFKVAARDGASNTSAQSAASNSVTPTASTGADTTAPGSTTITSVKPKQASAVVNWSAATDDVGVTNYRVYRDGTQVTRTGNVLTYTDTGLTNGQRYSYTVAAEDAAGNIGAQSVAKLVMPGQIVDNFDRTDSTTSLGSTEDGTAWTAPLSHTLSIASGVAKKTYASDSSASTGRAYNAFPGTTSTRAFRMAVTLGAAPANANVAAGGPVVRALADGSVFFYLGLRQSTSSFVYALFKVPSVGGAPSGQSANSTVQPQAGDFIELEMTSAAKTTLVVRVNGTQILSTAASFTNPTDATQDNFGLYQAGDSAFEYESISWTPLP